MNLLDRAAWNPYAALRLVLGGPLHPGGEQATGDLLDRAGVGEGDLLVDLGCGEGQAVVKALERGARAVGLDAEAEGADVRARHERLPLGADSVDVAFSECALCLAGDLDAALAELARVVPEGGRLAFSDVTVGRKLDRVPASLAEPLCLEGRRERQALLDRVEAAGFGLEDVETHREELFAMRDRVRERVDVEGLLAALGERGERLQAAVDQLEAALEAGDVGYVSVVARRV